jgi:hypothetical protein
MADFINELASKAGLEGDQAHSGIGALLAMLKSKLTPEAFSHLTRAIPGSEQMLSAFADKAQSAGGGMLDVIKNMAGKVFGGEEDAAAAVKNHLSSVGLSADHVDSLLPKLHDMVASKLPADVLAQIKEHVPGFSPSEEELVSHS